NELYGRIAGEVQEYVLRDMVAPEGCFYSAEDADSDGEEGKFYLWTTSEVKSVLGDNDTELFCSLYDVNEQGNFEGKSIPNLIGRGISEADRLKIEPLRQKLFAYREKRVHPYKDDKILTSWNGLMIVAMALGSRVLGDDRYYQAARQAADFILKQLRRPDGRLLARYREGESLYPAYAADYAFLIWGLIELYQADFEARYLQTALELNDDLIKYFWDSENGGLFINGEDSEQLLARPKEDYDGAIPSSNSVAALNFLRLARITGNNDLENMADQQLKAFGTSISEIPAAHSFFMIAALFYHNRSQEVVIAGKRHESDSREMLEVINKRFLPGTLVILKDAIDNEDIQEVIPFVKYMKMVDGRATAYICDNFSCQEPIVDIREFENILTP
ncbi:MAG: thioredoxin domain-containing protein, partial [Syntrophomonas sp.]